MISSRGITIVSTGFHFTLFVFLPLRSETVIDPPPEIPPSASPNKRSLVSPRRGFGGTSIVMFPALLAVVMHTSAPSSVQQKPVADGNLPGLVKRAIADGGHGGATG